MEKLEEYLLGVDLLKAKKLPEEVLMKLRLINLFKTKIKATMEEVELETQEFYKICWKLTEEERQKRIQDIQALQDKVTRYGEKEVSMAQELCDLVDKYVSKVNGEPEGVKSEEDEHEKTVEQESKQDDDKPIKSEEGSACSSNQIEIANLSVELESLIASSDMNIMEMIRRINGISIKTEPEEVSASNEKQVVSSSSKLSLVELESVTVKDVKQAANVESESEEDSACSSDQMKAQQESFGSDDIVLKLDAVELNDKPWNSDTKEPPFCVCRGVEFGDMVWCDGPCKEWYHFECVGLESAPKENTKWFCAQCQLVSLENVEVSAEKEADDLN